MVVSDLKKSLEILNHHTISTVPKIQFLVSFLYASRHHTEKDKLFGVGKFRFNVDTDYPGFIKKADRFYEKIR